MPFRLNEFRAKVAFVTSAETPRLVRLASQRRGMPSSTVWLQHVVAEALAEELDIPLSDLIENLPPNRATDPALFGGSRRMKVQ